MKGQSVGIWGARPRIKANLRRRKAVTLYGGQVEFLPNNNVALPQYVARLIFIDQDTPMALVHRAGQMLRLEPDRTFIASSVPNVFPTYQDQQVAINAFISWLDRAYQKQQRQTTFRNDPIRAAFVAGFPGWPTSSSDQPNAEEESSET